jgi:hypothetical protein
MARKGSLVASMKAAKDQVEAEAAAPAKPSFMMVNRASEPMITTAVHIPKAAHDLLRRVAVEMMALFASRQRTTEQYRDLLSEEGFQLQRVINTGTDVTIFEALAV